MWIRNTNPLTYKIAVESNVIPNINRGIYNATRIYEGVEEHQDLFILSFGGVYVVTDKIGDDIILTTNFPNISSGTYILDDSVSPKNETIYKKDNKYISIDNGNYMTIWGGYLLPNDIIHEVMRYDRSGNIITSPRMFKKTTDWDSTVTITNSNFVNFLLTQAEVDAGVTENDIKNSARASFDSNSYTYSFSPADIWSGWCSSSLFGEYEAFGGESGSQTVGYLNYTDSSTNEYTKSFEIIEDNGAWSVVYSENNQTYTTNTEPVDSDIIFINSEAEPQQITLFFDGYISRNKNILTTMTADDLV